MSHALENVSAPLKVAIVIGQLGIGGGERQLYLLLKHLDRSRIDPLVITFNPDQDDHFEAQLVQLGVPVRGVARTWNKALRVYALARILRQEQIQIVHAWDLHLSLMAALAGFVASVPVRLGSLRCDPVMHPAGKAYRLANRLGLDATVANSTAGRTKLEALGVNANRIDVVFNGVERNGHAGSRAAARALRAAWGVPEDALLLASIGRLNTGKNHALLIEAMASLGQELSGTHLVLFGQGPERDAIERESAQRGVADRVHLMGLVPNAPELLHAADMFCLTSNHEGMPNVILEAAAAGLPVVTTDVNGVRDVIVDGETGFIVPIGDAAAVADAVARLAIDRERRERMGEAARRRVEEHFTIEAAVEGLQEFYARHVSSPAARRGRSPHANAVHSRFENPDDYLSKDFDIRARTTLTHELLGDVSGMDILDAGCGDGRLSLQFAAEARSMTLIDSSKAMLDRARANCPQEFTAKVRFVQGDFNHVRNNDRFDVVLCVGVLAHVDSVPRAVATLASQLKPRGRIVFQLSDNDRLLTRLHHGFANARHFFFRRPKENRTTVGGLLAESRKHGLELGQIKSYSLMFPGLGRLPNQLLFKYQLASARYPALERLCSDRFVVFRKP